MSQNRISRKSQDDPLGLNIIQVEIIPAKTALLVIDMQKYGYDPNYGLLKLFRSEAPQIYSYLYPRLRDTVVPNIARLLRFFRDKHLRIIYVCVGPFLPDGSDMIARRQRREREHMRRTGVDYLFHAGTVEHEVLDELKPNAGELVIYKNSIGAFNSTAIDQLLRNMAIETLVITGAATNGCVETTARDAADRGYHCFLVDDGCATKNQELHDGTLRNFELLFGKVVTTEEIVRELQRTLGRSDHRKVKQA